MHSKIAVDIKDLEIRFGDLSVIKNMHFSIFENEFVSLLGPSGCGKSTLLRVITGLLAPTSGTVSFAENGKKNDLRVSMMFQKPLLLPWRTTLENILLPAEIETGSNHINGALLERAKRILSMVRLDEFEHAYPNQLSGGMQQRVALARTLMTDPDLLLLDEPFGALDELTRDALNEELLNIWRSDETRLKTVIMVTHSIQEAVAMSDRILVFAPRPARLADIINIQQAHPRAQESLEFIQTVSKVRHLVRSVS